MYFLFCYHYRFKKLPSLEYSLFSDSSTSTKNYWETECVGGGGEEGDGGVTGKNVWNEEENQNSLSSESSWPSSSGGTNSDSCGSPFENLFKRSSSSALSSENGDTGGPQVGTDFTRDFYRLVKFESSKSLASCSSKSQNGVEKTTTTTTTTTPANEQQQPPQIPVPPPPPHEENTAIDREHALQSVLRFIAEQQRYCLSRLVQDENCCTVAGEAMAFDGSENGGDDEEEDDVGVPEEEEVTIATGTTFEDDADDGYFSKISITNAENVTHNNTEEDDVVSCGACTTEDTNDSSFCDNGGVGVNVAVSSGDAAAAAVDASSSVKMLFKTCDSCFQSMESVDTRENDDESGGDGRSVEQNICSKCAQCYIECLPEEGSGAAPITATSSDRLCKYVSAVVPIVQKSCLDTVLEEQEESTTPAAGSDAERRDSVLVVSEQMRLVSFHERATSKEVIEELNRMIRKGGDEMNEHDRVTPVNDLDESFGCATGWVHVEQDIDFSDPKVSTIVLREEGRGEGF